MIYVRPDLRNLFVETTVSEFLQIPCEIVRRFKNRSMGRFVRNGRAFYIKVHRPGGWWPLAEDLVRLRPPQVGARSEWRVLEEVRELGILAPRVVAYGQEGRTLASQCSFLVTEEIHETISLETLGRRPKPWSADPTLKRRLIRAVAKIARELHTHGINHRDFYLCHFLLDLPVEGPSADREPRLHLIDLHRAQKRAQVPRRWLAKDLGGLLFSAMDIDLQPRDLALFVRCYSGKPFREEMRDNSPLWQSVVATADRLYRKIHRKSPKLELSRGKQCGTVGCHC